MATHDWIKNGEDIDHWQIASGYHNGPACQRCGFSFCEHCAPDGWNTECGTPAIAPDNSKLDRTMVAMDNAMRASVGLPKVR